MNKQATQCEYSKKFWKMTWHRSTFGVFDFKSRCYWPWGLQVNIKLDLDKKKDVNKKDGIF